MHTFKVWAPNPKQVELVLDDPSGDGPAEKQIPMQPGEGGWWTLTVEGAGAGTSYGFLLDGDGPFPDPCSPWQPDGVHGLSRVIDHRVFAWSDEHFQARPLPSAVIYELHVGTFTEPGTFDAAILKLDDLVELGITHIELLPVAEFPGRRGWGYDGVDLYAPHHAYGGPTGLKRLVDAAHARGLAVILDVVYNHLGPDGNYLDRYGPYHSKMHNTAWGAAMNFDGPGSDGVRRFFLENALMWLSDYHIDGLRLDAVHAIIDNSAIHFLEELAYEVADLGIALGRHLVLTAESALNDPRLVQPFERGGFGLNAQWADEFHHALHVLLTGEMTGYYQGYAAWESLADALKDVFVFNGRYNALLERRHGRPVVGLPGWRFISFLQNHDHVGNRATGDRIHQQAGDGPVRVAAAILMASPFIPLIFQGEEWAASSPFQYFTDHQDKQLARAVREGRRREFGAAGWKPEEVPDPQEPATFAASKLNWTERFDPPHAEMLEWYRRLIALRRSHADLLNGRLEDVAVEFDRDRAWLLLRRGGVTLACSFSDGETRIPCHVKGGEQVLLAASEAERIDQGEIILPPYGVIFYQSEPRE